MLACGYENPVQLKVAGTSVSTKGVVPKKGMGTPFPRIPTPLHPLVSTVKNVN